MPETDKTQAQTFLQRVLNHLKQADNAMYKAKNQGRNNIQIYQTGY